MLRCILLASALSLFSGVSASPLEIQDRANTCAHDNLYRCVVDKRYSVAAADYCAALTYTSTVATTTATATATASRTITVSTETDIASSTATVWSTVPASTVTVTSIVDNVAKRTAAASPACMSNYPLSRLTSVCSCVSVPAKTIRVTYTATTVTVTTTGTSFATTTTSTTAWATVSTVTTTGVQTVTLVVPRPTVTNGNFEAGLSAWYYYDNSDADWSGSTTQATGSSGASSSVFALTNSGDIGFAMLSSQSKFNLIAGVTYRLGFEVKSLNYGAQTDYSHVSCNFRTNYGYGIQWDELSGGSIRANGWVYYERTFTVDSSYAGTDVSLSFWWARDTVTSTYYIDNVYLVLA